MVDQTPKGTGVANLKLVKYENKPVLTWSQGQVTEAAFGDGKAIANDHYETIAHVHTGNGLNMDIHEFAVTNSGQAWADATSSSACRPAAKKTRRRWMLSCRRSTSTPAS